MSEFGIIYKVTNLDKLEIYPINSTSSMAPTGYNLNPGGRVGGYINNDKVIVYSLGTKTTTTYISISEAARKLNGDKRQAIRCCKGQARKHKNPLWFYEDEYVPENFQRRIEALFFKKLRTDASSSYLGVSRDNVNGWQVSIGISKNKTKNLGSYTTEAGAAKVYRETKLALLREDGYSIV